MSEKEWWEPVLTDAAWVAATREEYPDECDGLDDDEVRDEYAEGMKYQTLWDNLGDARDEHEALADAYLALRAENERLREALEKLRSVTAGFAPYSWGAGLWLVANSALSPQEEPAR